jgi:L-alanine-DL-glutamate epimerase-like enolase superfamily enzyme
VDNILHLRSLRPLLFRHRLQEPVVVSFGTMHERAMVLVRAEDMDGVVGWGEIWCNFPEVGAEHRAKLVGSVLAPLALSRPFEDPTEAFEWLTARTDVLGIQSGEPGPLAQAIAGIDIALWDLSARRAGKPLWSFLGGHSPTVSVYASGLNPDQPVRMALTRRSEGHTSFKVKIGFGEELDLRNLKALRAALGSDCRLMADVNQGWSLEEALRMAPQLEAFDLDWLEEPLRADRPWAEWQALSEVSGPLAAGENLRGEADFRRAIESGTLRVLQPDAAKWGGVSGCLPVAREATARGLRYCPHYLGGGIGLLASAHLLAAEGGDGLLEVDANPNPLRELLCGAVGEIRDGTVTLSSAPGLGPEPDVEALSRHAVP